MGKYAITVEAKDQNQANLIEESLRDKGTKAFVMIVGALRNLPTKRAQERVIKFAIDYLDEQKTLAEAEAE